MKKSESPERSLRILIIEDEVSLRNALREKLEQEGYSILEAKDGKEGLEAALREKPDLILLDIILPVMDGMTMLKKLREAGGWGKSARVIILTNLSSDSNKIINDVTVLEPSYYLVKSDWKLDELLVKVKEVLGFAE